MGCCSSAKPKKAEPKGQKPVQKQAVKGSADPAPPSLSNSPVFSIKIGSEEINAVLTSTRLAITVSSSLSTPEAFKQAQSNPRLHPETFFHFIGTMQVAFVATDATLDNTFKFESKVMKAGAKVVLEGKVFDVTHANRNRIMYNEDPSIRPGTPIISEANVVGLHEKSGRGISMNWICSELKANAFSLGKELENFLSTVQGDFVQPDAMSRIYSISQGKLLSCCPDTNEFLDHTIGLLPSAKICYIPNGVFIAGGLDNSVPSPSVRIYDSLSDFLMDDRAPLKLPRFRHTVCFCKGFVYCFGGEGGNKRELVENEKYGVRLNTWDTAPAVPNLPGPRLDAGAVVFKAVVYLVGGVANAPDVLKLQDNGWATLRPELPAFTSLVLAEGDNAFIYICSQKLWRWSPETNEVRILTEVGVADANTARLYNSSFYVFADKAVHEARLDKDPTTWTIHTNSIPNFV